MTYLTTPVSHLNSISSYGPVSLRTSEWTLRHRDTWDEKHHEFFAKSFDFYQNTMRKLASGLRHAQKPGQKAFSQESWVLESAKGFLFGRIQLQFVLGEFNQGVIFFDLIENHEGIDPTMAIAQLITSQFLALALDTQKIVPLGKIAEHSMKRLVDSQPKQIMTLSNNVLPEVIFPVVYEYDQPQWLNSTAGQSSLLALSWLQKRIDRIEKSRELASKTEKRPLLLSILTMGRHRRRSEKMIHPLDKLSSRRR